MKPAAAALLNSALQNWREAADRHRKAAENMESYTYHTGLAAMHECLARADEVAARILDNGVQS